MVKPMRRREVMDGMRMQMCKYEEREISSGRTCSEDLMTQIR